VSISTTKDAATRQAEALQMAYESLSNAIGIVETDVQAALDDMIAARLLLITILQTLPEAGLRG